MADEIVYNPDLTQPVDAPTRSAGPDPEVAAGEAPAAAAPPRKPGVAYIEVEEDEPEDDEAAPEHLSADSESQSDDSDDAAAAEADDDLETLRRKAKLADEWEAWKAEAEASRQDYELQQADQAKIAQFEDWYAKQVQYALWQAAQSPDPDTARLNIYQQASDLRNAWYGQFYQSQRDRDQRKLATAHHLLRAQQLCATLGLPAQAADDLISYPPHLLEREALKLKQQRDREAQLRRQATTNARKAKKAELARTNPAATGSGRAASSGGRQIEAGSIEHYLYLNKKQPLRTGR